ncbi:MAG TPA: hypothetical protein VKA84_14650 [Gemmatimonadaceae bacterium]|nr:hypothetical protein [Gemmatimonadaceae bacterium]
MHVGRHEDYHWLVSAELDLHGLLRACSGCVVGRFVAVTAFDSGPLGLLPEEAAAGWRRVGDVAFSPRVPSPDALPTAGYDEWYVFREPPAPFEVADTFVNYAGFTLRDSAERRLRERFWAELARLRPVAYLSEGGNLVVATRDAADFAAIERWARVAAAEAARPA